MPFELLSAAELAQAELALAAVSHKLTGGLRLPGDETGDCQMFTTRLAALAEADGRQVPLQHADRRARHGRRPDRRCAVRPELVRADSFVVALGSYSTNFLSGLVKIPVYPLKGYSITAPIVNEAAAPVSTVLDETVQDRDYALRQPDSRRRDG